MKRLLELVIYSIPLIIGITNWFLVRNWFTVRRNIYYNTTDTFIAEYQLEISVIISIIAILFAVFLNRRIKKKSIINKILLILSHLVNISYLIFYIYFLILILLIAVKSV